VRFGNLDGDGADELVLGAPLFTPGSDFYCTTFSTSFSC
jgi:hypothetical protein